MYDVSICECGFCAREYAHLCVVCVYFLLVYICGNVLLVVGCRDHHKHKCADTAHRKIFLVSVLLVWLTLRRIVESREREHAMPNLELDW